MHKRPDVYLELAIRALQRVPVFLGGCTREQYLADDLRQAAVERQLEVAGDALAQLRKLDAALFARIPDGPMIIAFRNVLAHGYATLDHRRVFDVAVSQVGVLREVLERMLAEIPELSDTENPEGPGGRKL